MVSFENTCLVGLLPIAAGYVQKGRSIPIFESQMYVICYKLFLHKNVGSEWFYGL